MKAEFSPDGKVLAAASDDDGMLRLWNLNDWDESSRWSKAELNEAPRKLNSISFSPDNRFVLTVEDKARLYDAASLQKRLVVELGGHSGVQAQHAEFSRDGKYIVMANSDGTVFVWELNSFRSPILKRLKPNGPAILMGFDGPGEAAISSDGKFAAVLESDEARGGVSVWDIDSGGLLRQLWHGEEVRVVSFSTDDKFIVTAGGNRVKLWDAGSGEEMYELQVEDEVTGVSLCSDHRLLLVNVKETVQVRDLNSRHIVLEVKEEGGALSPDGNFVLSLRGKAVQVREVSTGRLIVELSGHVDDVYSAAFSPDNKYVVTTSGYEGATDIGGHIPNDANEVRVWDVSSGNLIYEFKEYNARMLSGVFSPDGKSVLVLAADGTIFSYSCEVCVPQNELLKLAEKRHLRPLTAEERTRYLHE
ncbi:MAG TPA: WD40 repeat domain-containing protein [Pyrinomonadaceae bacterium]|nr:WD40 repeat domain-containing protein [Pyrinomonadaceae bacterium]